MSTDERPRPEYGEYASETEWASAVKRSGAELPEKTLAHGTPATPSPPAAHTGQRAPGTGRTTGNTADRLSTIFLLSFGLVYVIGGAGGYLSLAATIERMFGLLGVGEYTPTELTPVFGVIIVVSQAIIWLATAVWSFARLRQGRLTLWVPLVGGVVNFLISALLLGILLASDPAFLAFATTS